VEDCKDKCLSSKTCNWKPWEYSDNTWGPTSEENCLDEDLGDNFCAATNEWGGIEDLTEFGYCSPTTGIAEENYGWGSYYSSESSSITDELCQELDSTLTAKKAYEWSDQKRCQFPSAMSQSSAACFDGCASDGGFKPPTLYECYVPSNLELCRQRQRGSTRLRRLGFDVVRVRAADERIQDGRCDRVGRD
tara:strand:- start:2528 stop:3100 length:573 start_codon:yes stop_codon:yes gene_type:complete